MGRQQYVVKPMAMDDETTNNNNNNNGSSTSTTGSDNPAVAGSSGVVSESALELAPTLTEAYLREHGVPLQQAIQQVNLFGPQKSSRIIRERGGRNLSGQLHFREKSCALELAGKQFPLLHLRCLVARMGTVLRLPFQLLLLRGARGKITRFDRNFRNFRSGGEIV